MSVIGKNINNSSRFSELISVYLFVLLFLLSGVTSFSQVVTNNGAVINITASTAINSGSVNNASGTISNAGTISLTADYINSSTVSGNGTYNVAGNWTNNSTFTSGISTVNFNGSLLQTLSGSSPSAFYNITVNGTGIALLQNASFTKKLTLTKGLISGIDTMTLVSNASGDAMLAAVGAGITQASITAMFTIQRYENTRTKASYAALSSPVLTTTIGDWNLNNRAPAFYMSGVGGPDGTSAGYVSVKKYGETTNTYNNITTYTSPGINYVIKQGEGIYLWEGTGLSTMTTPFSFNTHGIPTIGNVSVAVTNTTGKGAGFNIVGNPYPAPIDWVTFQAANSSLQSSFYIYEQDGTWHVFTSGSIAMEQGFGVVTTTNATLSFQETCKTALSGLLELTSNPSQEANTATFILSNNSNEFSCPTIISFDPSYVKDYDPSEDAYYIESYVEEVPRLFTVSKDNKNLMLNKLPDADNTLDIPLTAVAGVQAEYTLTAQNIDNVTSYNCVALMDAGTGEVLNNFKENPSYTFNVSSAPESKNFVLRFTKLAAGQSCSPAGSAANNGVQVYPSTAGAFVSFNLQQNEDVAIAVYNVLGQKVSSVNRTIQNGVIDVPMPPTEAVYIVKVETKYGIFTKKIYHK